MTAETSTTHVGPWRRLENLSAERKGSIHDDEAAQSLGFRAAFVPGSTVGTAAMPGIVALYGPGWFEGGWYNFKFVTPVYTSEDVREEGLLIDGRLELKVVTPEGRLCCSGQAGLGFERPWDAGHNGKHGAEAVLPGVELGARYDETEIRVTAETIAPMLRASGDATPWYQTESPFGRPLIAPEYLQNFALQITRTRRLEVSGVRNPGMWAEHSLAVQRPLFLDEPYVMREWIADKGLSGRTVFLTYEYEVMSEGEVAAAGRHKVKWLKE